MRGLSLGFILQLMRSGHKLRLSREMAGTTTPRTCTITPYYSFHPVLDNSQSTFSQGFALGDEGWDLRWFRWLQQKALSRFLEIPVRKRWRRTCAHFLDIKSNFYLPRWWSPTALSAPDNVAASGFRWPSPGPAERSLTFHKHLRVHSCTEAQNNPIKTLITAYFNSANTKYILSYHPYENKERIF